LLIMEKVRLTKYSPGAGCGCKISPADLEEILRNSSKGFSDKMLLVGNESNDDAAVYDIGNNQAIISTTDFFTPIVDDPFIFGKIAAINAMSDIYAMGGKPIMAISILGWPLVQLSKEHASQVIEGAISACAEAGIMLAGGHSIDIQVPIFGLAVTGIIARNNIKRNNTAIENHRIFLTKPLGIGILSTAAKKEIILDKHLSLSIESMSQLNSIGTELAKLQGVSAMTDVTGFGLLGHLVEMCDGGKLSADLHFDKIPRLEGIDAYIEQKSIPGGTYRNLKSYESVAAAFSVYQKIIMADPQTSGGLLIAIDDKEIPALLSIAEDRRITVYEIGQFCLARSRQEMIRLL
jgi:selenide,water dikinase